MIKNYGVNYDEILKDLDQELTLKINRKYYKELTNVSYEVDYHANITLTALPDEADDKAERFYLINTLTGRLNVFEDEEHSRRLVFPNLYPNGLCKCISLVNAYIREDKFYVNVFIRSQNFLENFKYDCETMAILMHVGIEELSLSPGKITVFCTNLHKEIT